MAPKKAKKITLGAFLGDTALGSWADEMDSLPNAPAARSESESNDRYGRKDDFLSSRPDRSALPPREDVPIPNQPPYTAFVGNLSFDVGELDLEGFFTGQKIKSAKIIRDKDDKPKGFGYVEFEDVDGLREALSKTGSNFAGRNVRISVAEPPKERSGFQSNADDSGRFEGPWRRDGPLPDHPSRGGDPTRRRFEGGEKQPPSVSESISDWRSNRPPRASEPEPQFKRKPSSFASDHQGSADKEEAWVSRFKPSTDENPSSKFASRSRVDSAAKDSPADEPSDWRKRAPRPTVSPNSSTPPTPQLARRKLDLIPRSGGPSVSPSPLSSPKMGPSPSASNPRSDPFGGARPVDVTSREREVLEKHSVSRSSSRTGVERGPVRAAPAATQHPKTSVASVVRPAVSFASAAAKKEAGGQESVEKVTDELSKSAI